MTNKINVLIGADDREINKALKRTRENIKKSTAGMKSNFASMAKGFVASAVTIGTALTVFKGMKKLFTDGFQAVESMNLSIASSAALITTFSEKAKTDLAGAYRDAYRQSTKLAQKIEDINGNTLATGEQLRIVNQELLKKGVIMDTNNRKEVKGMESLTNAIAILTAGSANQSMQFSQEMRALLEGQARAGSTLAKLVKDKLGASWKSILEDWKRSGTFLSNMGKMLKGFDQASGDIKNTWASVGTTLKTVYEKVLRDEFRPMFEGILSLTRDITEEIKKWDADRNMKLSLSISEKDFKRTKEFRASLLKGMRDENNLIKRLSEEKEDTRKKSYKLSGKEKKINVQIQRDLKKEIKLHKDKLKLMQEQWAEYRKWVNASSKPTSKPKATSTADAEIGIGVPRDTLKKYAELQKANNRARQDHAERQQAMRNQWNKMKEQRANQAEMGLGWNDEEAQQYVMRFKGIHEEIKAHHAEFCKDLQSNFSTTIQEWSKGGLTFKEFTDGLWQGIKASFIKMLADMIAKFLAQKAILMLINPALGSMNLPTMSVPSSAGGDWNVQQSGLRMIHEKETVLPEDIAQSMRTFFDNGNQQQANNAGGGLDSIEQVFDVLAKGVREANYRLGDQCA